MRILPQTPRRSKRGQPIATPAHTKVDSNLHLEWVGAPLYTRPTNPELDWLPEEQDENAAAEDDNDGDGDAGSNVFETIFYRSFEMQKTAPARTYRAKTKGKKKTSTDEAPQTYAVGDTVLIKTDALSLKNELPSVGVIVSMWETKRKASNSGNQSDKAKMKLRVHWFIRPPKPRPGNDFGMKREHAKNEIYYSLTQAGIAAPELILGRCKITTKPAKPHPNDAHGEPSRPGSPTKRGRIYDDESDEEDREDGPSFYCRCATSGQSAIYYDFDWENHYLEARQSSFDLPSEVDIDWGSGVQWNVRVARSRKKPSAKGKREAASSSSRLKKKPRLETIDSEPESEGDGTDDEFIAPDGEDEDDELPDASVHGEDSEPEPEPEISDDDNFLDALPRTPSKNRNKRKRTSSSVPSSPTKRTPRKPRKTVVQPTPHSKSILKKKAVGTPSRKSKFAVRPRQVVDHATLDDDLSHLPKDSWLRAMHVLHVGARPDALPCREEEFEKVLRCIGELLEEESGGCVYISGVPGTGKTATVHAVVRQLKRMAESGEANPFTYVEINGLRIPEPSAAYSLLWEGVSGHDASKEGHLRISAKESLKALTRYFSGGGRSQGPQGHACIVLMDELDQLVTAKQDVVYNFFNWPTLTASKLIVIAVANTMDLPERVMSGRVRSRLGMIRINFQPYTTLQLEKIVQARLECVKHGMGDTYHDVIGPDAIKFASMKVSSISGDARRVLDISRRTVELVHADKRVARVGEVKEVIQQMQNSPTAAYLRDCSLHERMMLASLVKCIKREGVEEIQWGEVQHQHLLYVNVLTSDDDPKRKPTVNELQLVLDSLVASRAMLVEDGPAVARKPEGERRVLLNLEQGEVERVLSEVGGPRWKNVLCT